MKISSFVAFALIVLLKIDTSGQPIMLPAFEKVKPETGNFKSINIKPYYKYQNEIRPSCMMIAKPYFETNIKSMPEGVYYTAFFCKLETRLRNCSNIWIKMRIGDFNDYENQWGITNKKP